MSRKQKLELTWIGKEDRARLEPRILIEDSELSYHAAIRRDGDIFDNMLIQGDNLLALRALEQDFSSKIKCVYIDPPFNTQQAFEHYDDGVEHSIWLTLLRERIEIIHRLMSNDGTLFVHIDDNELGYLVVLLDEIFGRQNRVSIVTFKQGAATGHKAINPGVVSTSNFVLIYAKTKSAWIPNRLFTARAERDKRYNQYIVDFDGGIGGWKFGTLTQAFAASLGLPERGLKKVLGDEYDEKLTAFIMSNARRVVRLARPDYDAVSAEARVVIDKSRRDKGRIFHLERSGYSDMYFSGGERILFYADKLKLIDGQYVAGEPLTSIWDDLLSNNLHNEGAVEFPKGKKPEALIKRCIEISTQKGDVVLDSFAGSGTTGAVAHKMGRQWIMIELRAHAVTHCVPRLQSVIDNRDLSGVTNSVGWQGGGGFRFYRLAPSLLTKDRFDNWVIAKQYNPAMLAEAMCKLMGFTYAPSLEPEAYWQHGHSSETDFIYVTTQSLTHDALRKLSEEVGAKRTLLVCCKAFSGREASFLNLTIKKIPQVILAKCEWGRDDYSLQVANLPVVEDEPVENSADDAEEPPAAMSRKRGRARKTDTGETSLFAELALDPEGA
jgi:adenine-specific DNA-methyltransferase